MLWVRPSSWMWAALGKAEATGRACGGAGCTERSSLWGAGSSRHWESEHIPVTVTGLWGGALSRDLHSRWALPSQEAGSASHPETPRRHSPQRPSVCQRGHGWRAPSGLCSKATSWGQCQPRPGHRGSQRSTEPGVAAWVVHGRALARAPHHAQPTEEEHQPRQLLRGVDGRRRCFN